MRFYGIEEPLDQWEVELRKVSKNGLLDLVEQLLFKLQWFGMTCDRDSLLKLAQHARKNGRDLDAHASHLRLMADIPGEVERRYRKSQAAKKAARRRKREARKKAA